MLQGFVVLHKIVLDTTRNSSNISDFVLYHKLFQLVLYLGIPAINFISFLTVRGGVEGSLLPLVLQLGNTLGFSPKLVSQKLCRPKYC